MQICPYLTFNGTAQEALNFYAHALGGTVEAVMKFSEIPDGTKVPPNLKDRVAHGRVIFPNGAIMISDSFEEQPITYSGFNVQTSWSDVTEAKSAFDKMSEGGEVIMPFEPTFWAAGFGNLKDQFGVGWMFNCETPNTA